MRPPSVCDLCGSSQNVRTPFLTLWNGTAFDLCNVCSYEEGVVRLLDEMSYRIWSRQAGRTPPPAATRAPAGAQGAQPGE